MGKTLAVIDAHTHAFRDAAQALNAMGGAPRVGYVGTLDDLKAIRRKAGIQTSVLLALLPSEGMRNAAQARLPADLTPEQRAHAEGQINETIIGRLQRLNTWACDAAREDPGIVPFINIAPFMDAERMRREIVEKVERHGARGVKLHPEEQRFHMNDRRMWPCYETAQALDLPIVAHSGVVGMFNEGWSHPKHWADVLEAFPRLRLVMAHMGADFWPEPGKLAKKYPQLCFDVCAVISEGTSEGRFTDAEWTGIIRDIGAHRFLYGSDFPWFDPARDIARVLRLPLTADEKRLLLAENARRVLKLA